MFDIARIHKSFKNHISSQNWLSNLTTCFSSSNFKATLIINVKTSSNSIFLKQFHFFYSWDDELAEVAQIWADQCANVIYFHQSDIYPRIFHERGFERTTSRFNAPPGVGQNVAWALTKHVNFTRIIDDLWYRDINKLQPGRIGDFQVRLNLGLAAQTATAICDVAGKIVLNDFWNKNNDLTEK